MNLRNFVLLAGLAIFLAGCVVNPRPYRDYDQRYADDYYDYRDTPSYEGYYYARIIFISNVPYYVDDDRHIRSIPPGLHDHFRRYPYNTLGRPPVFSHDTEMRDGYRVSRIIYLDGVPYNVENDRVARPLPEPLHQHFRYTPSRQDNVPANGNRPQPPDQRDNGRHDNERHNEPVPDGRDRERIVPPPFDRGQHEGERGAPADARDRIILSPEPHNPPLRPGQPNAVEAPVNAANGMERDRHGNRPQAVDDTGKKNADKKKADKNKSRPDKKDKPDEEKKPHREKDGDQGGNGNRHD